VTEHRGFFDPIFSFFGSVQTILTGGGSQTGTSTAAQDILEQIGAEQTALELEQERIVIAQEQFRRLTGTQVTVAPGTLVLPVGFQGPPGPGQIRAEDVLARTPVFDRPFEFLRRFGTQGILILVVVVGVGLFALTQVARIRRGK